jgi:hypothetical protein
MGRGFRRSGSARRRGAYLQWEEGGIAPQVVFEVLSPSNSRQEMAEKLAFYDRHGVEEYYLYDPSENRLAIWLRQRTADGLARLAVQSHVGGWVSPRLGVRFTVTAEKLELTDPVGRPFLSAVQLARRAEQEAARAAAADRHAKQESKRAEEADQRALQEARRAEEADQRAERLAARLRALGIDPTEV